MKSKRTLQWWAYVAQILATVVATVALAVALEDRFKISTPSFNSWFDWLAAHSILVVCLAVALLVVLLRKRLAFASTELLKLLQAVIASSWRVLKRALRRFIILNRTVVLSSFVSLLIILWALPLYIMYGVLVWAGVVGTVLTLFATAIWLNTFKLKKKSSNYSREKDNPLRYPEESDEERRREWEDRNPPGPDGDW